MKKLRALVRRIDNRGYATMARLSAHIDRLSAGDEANAVLEALDAVNLMTVHASKGLEFPIVFLVNIGRGVAQRRPAVRVRTDADERRVLGGGRRVPVGGRRRSSRRRSAKRPSACSTSR